MLEKMNAADQATDLKVKLTAWVSAHPDSSAAPAAAPAPPAADSSGTPASGKAGN